MTSEPITTLIDELLLEQQSLSAVNRFAQRHARGTLPVQSNIYSDLIPLSAPSRSRDQYAFEVDLDQCSGCKACVTACHSLNGLDTDEAWRTAGPIHGDNDADPFQQTVTTACHHCLDPACLNGCPVLAYEKDPITGIVRHLDDQCIGCQYCVWKCPYEVPQYSKRLGIVRKCDMCSNRLAEGEAPACVQACPNQAIRIQTVSAEEVHARIASHSSLVPGAPSSSLTLPTTRYRSNRPAKAAQSSTPLPPANPEPPHWPLIFMLTLTQLGIGLECVTLLLRLGTPVLADTLNPALALASLVSVLLGLGIGAAHLGQPLRAWRAFLGFRKSWLSREFVAFGLLAPLLALQSMMEILSPPMISPTALLTVNALATLTGLASLLCSIMIYHDTGRPSWRFSVTGTQFAGTTALLGLAAYWLALSTLASPGNTPPVAGTWLAAVPATLLLILMSTKLLWAFIHAGFAAP